MIPQRFSDEGPRADAALEKTLRIKLRIGVENRETGDSQGCCEGAAGRNLLPWSQPAAKNRVAKAGVDLAMERCSQIPTDGDERDDSGDEVGHYLNLSGYGELGASGQNGMPILTRLRLDAAAAKRATNFAATRKMMHAGAMPGDSAAV